MRKFLRIAFVLLFVLSGLTLTTISVQAHEPHECPEGIPDRPVLPGHMDQADIVSGALAFTDIFEHGALLFEARFNVCDGQGRPATTGTGNAREPEQPLFTRVSAPDANSCEGCHNQPRVGGAGDIVANVFVLGQAADPVLDSISPEFSDFRNTLGMFGAGPIEMLAREMTTDLHAIRQEAVDQAMADGEAVTLSLDTKGVNFGEISAMPDGEVDTSGVRGVDADLIIKPFHQVGVVVSLREFSNNAFNHHHGMQSEERFDLVEEKGPDFDQDGLAAELTVGDITAASIWQAALGVPGRVLPSSPADLAQVSRGEVVFSEIGCTSCHVSEMRLETRFFSEPNPFNPAGNLSDTSESFSFDMTTTGEGPYLERDGDGAIIRAFTDLKRHDLCDEPDMENAIRFFCNEQLAQTRPDQDGRPGTEFFLTRKLWDVGNSDPFGHVGDVTTMAEAILLHGGEARAIRDDFVALPTDDQRAVVEFLRTLQVLPVGSDPVVIAGASEQARAPMAGIAAASGFAFIGLLGVGGYFAVRRRSGDTLDG